MSITVDPPVGQLEPPAPASHLSRHIARRGHLSAAPPGRGRLERPAAALLLVATALAYSWNLAASGYANSFYAAAVEAGTKSWKAFLFGSIDSANFITVDKPPASLWLMELSGRIFGFSSWSMLLPEAFAGVAAVGLLYAGVRRWFGPLAGLLAGAALATTPVAALMFRFNNPDALLVLVLTAAAYTLVRALEGGRTRFVVATGSLVGFAFLVKMLQAFTVLPAFYLVYLVAAPGSFARRLRQLALMSVAVGVSAGWWVATVALWPAASRPYVDGSPSNSIVNLILGYNGLGRLTGSGGQGANFSGATGIFRLFNDLMGGQASWLLPAALSTTVVGLLWRRRTPRTDRTRAAIVLWGGWLFVTGAVFSLGHGVIHTYYTVAIAPAAAALFAIGADSIWRNRAILTARLIGAAGLLATGGWAFALLERTPDYLPWLRIAVGLGALCGALGLVVVPLLARGSRLALPGVATVALLVALAGPLAYSANTIDTAHTGSIPSAGPSVASGGGGGGFGGAGAPGGAGGTPPRGAPTGGFGAPPSGAAGGPGRGRTSSLGAPSGAGGASGGGASTSSALVKALEASAARYRWVAATFGSQSAASLELASGGEPVMAIGGFDGEGGDITLAEFEAYVAAGDIHYFIASGAGGGPGGSSNADSAITSWVEAHFSARSIGGETVYDLSSPH